LTGRAESRTNKRKLFAPADETIRRKKAETIGKDLNPDGDGGRIFPSDLSYHWMAFLFKRHNYDDQSTEKMKLHDTVLLPIPSNIVEQIQVDYNSAALGAVRGEISDMIAQGSGAGGGTAAKKFLAGAGDLITGIFDKDTYSGGNETLGAGTLGLRTGNEYVAAGLNRFFGSAPNPHLTVLFQGVGLRTHNFTWKLAPANIEESKALSGIINRFRGSMLPERGASNLTLKYPDEIDIFIGGSEVGHLYHFKRAVIRNFSANYAPDGQPSFFRGGAPTAVSISLDLMETEIHTREDYEPDIDFSNITPSYGDTDIVNQMDANELAARQKREEERLGANPMKAVMPDGPGR
jgi:hypothetical protein